MGRKSSSKNQPPEKQAPVKTSSGFNPMLLGGILVLVVSIGVLAFWRGGDPASTAASPSAASAANAATPAATSPATQATASSTEPTPESIAAAQAAAALGPRKQANLPPVPFGGFAPPRPPQVVNAAFQFAAEHPEVLSYVPCFCGCQHQGHRGNEDCFVRARAANGDVTEWEPHGVECAVCIDVATRARQMYSSGASVRDIRAAVEKEFSPNSPSMTPTPKPPAAQNH